MMVLLMLPGLFSVLEVAAFGVSNRPAHLFGAIAAMFVGGLVVDYHVNPDGPLAVLLGAMRIRDVATIAIAAVVVLILSGAGAHAFDRWKSLDRTGEKVLQKTDVAPMSNFSWLIATWIHMPVSAQPLVESIRELVRHMPSEMPAESRADIDRKVGDARELLACWDRVRAASAGMDGAATGEDELVDGLRQIRDGIAQTRQAVADDALKQLKIQERYVETKYEA